jgi:UDP-N-acetylmuramyl pentapeptide phosphotransferase/UDP-N-acetylglucosamine-1-phosphate transferase
MSFSTAAVLVLTFAAAFGITALLVPPVMRLCERQGWMAIPGGRRQHALPTPKIGGIALYAGFVAALVLTFALGAFVPQLRRSGFETLRVELVLLGGTVIFLTMLVDDLRELAPRTKLAAQFAAALIAVGPFLWDHTLYPGDEARGIILTAFNVPFVGQINLYELSAWLAIVATMFWLVAMNNTINFSDGLDGLAAGVSLIAATMLALHSLRLGQYTIALLPLALAGACAGFLLFNFPPARIFMGDCGAEFLGFVLGVSAIIGGAKMATVLLVLGVPILDVAWLVVARVRAGRPLAQGGRDHLHHRLIDLGLTPRQVLLFYYTLSASFGLLGITDTARSVKLLALALLGLIVGIVLMYAGRRAGALPSE